jgi:hypothetical protein
MHVWTVVFHRTCVLSFFLSTTCVLSFKLFSCMLNLCFRYHTMFQFTEMTRISYNNSFISSVRVLDSRG